MRAEERFAVAGIDSDAAPDWARAEIFVDAFAYEDLERLLDSPAPFPPGQFGGGIVAVRAILRADLGQLRAALADDHPELARFAVAGLDLLVTCEDVEEGELHGALSRLVWSGTLAQAGFHDARPPLTG